MSGPAGRQRLLAGFQRAVDAHADAPAVRESDGRVVSYADLARTATALAAALDEPARATAASPIGLLLERSGAAYAAMWASIALGRPYVPLNPAYPTSRLAEIVDQAGIDQVVTTARHGQVAADLGVDAAHTVVVDDLDLTAAAPEIDGAASAETSPGTSRGTTAYILFTSGSTGAPKGVPISYDNLWAFVDNMAATIPYEPGDVCSQVCELSFDFSVHEIYLALLGGATLCPARMIDLFNPAQYVARHGITVWISVPSLARVVLANRPDDDDQLDSVRLSIFNGEALTADLAAQWQQAAPNSVVWNNYGPTECAVAVTTQLVTDDPALAESDVVSIGVPFADCATALDVDGTIVTTGDAPEGTVGELLLDGPQRFAGYLDATLASPFAVDGSRNWYRTGDRAMWRDGRLYHLGRLDHQVKVGGHRIELLEVEHRIRRWLDDDNLAVIAHPAASPSELVLFTTAPLTAAPTAEATGLPAYMVPKRTVTVAALPRTAHGKLDRNALDTMAVADR